MDNLLQDGGFMIVLGIFLLAVCIVLVHRLTNPPIHYFKRGEKYKVVRGVVITPPSRRFRGK